MGTHGAVCEFVLHLRRRGVLDRTAELLEPPLAPVLAEPLRAPLRTGAGALSLSRALSVGIIMV